KVYRDESGFSKNKEFWEGAPITTRKIDAEELSREIDEAELETALRKLRNWKADGSDHTPPEIFKTAKPGSGFFFFLLRLFRGIWDSGKLPERWNTAEVVPVPKKGDTRDPDNYRGISLIAVGLKLFNSVLARRLSKCLEDSAVLVREQAGFRRGEECGGHS
ncbi:MAG: uncharacterized protein A8A55_3558, partial [Amphiamblys sp. WSBS2006]